MSILKLLQRCRRYTTGYHGFVKVFRFIRGFILRLTYYPYQEYSERIGRSYAFAKVGWNNYDFDFSYVYHLMSFKLLRLQDDLVHGYALQEKEDMDALAEMIVIVDRLGRCDYEDEYLEQHDKKWGAAQMRFEREPGETNSQLFMDRPNVKNPEDEEQERKEFLDCMNKGSEDRNKDIDRLTEILKVHAPRMWE